MNDTNCSACLNSVKNAFSSKKVTYSFSTNLALTNVQYEVQYVHVFLYVLQAC